MDRFVSRDLRALLSIVAMGLAACGAQTPEERVAGLRARHTATLNGFIVKATPVDEITPDAGPGVEGVEETATEAPQVLQTVLLDLLVQHQNDESLPGITVDVSMVGEDKVEKAHWRVWVETAGLPKANHKQVTHELSDVPYVEGDGFYAEVRSPIPATERDEYREFTEISGF